MNNFKETKIEIEDKQKEKNVILHKKKTRKIIIFFNRCPHILLNEIKKLNPNKNIQTLFYSKKKKT